MIYNRTELTISKDAKWHARQRAQKAAGALQVLEGVLTGAVQWGRGCLGVGCGCWWGEGLGGIC